MLDGSADCLAIANVAPIDIAPMSNASVDFLADAKANAADTPFSACVCPMRARIASPTPRPMLSLHLLRARERPMQAPIALPMPG